MPGGKLLLHSPSGDSSMQTSNFGSANKRLGMKRNSETLPKLGGKGSVRNHYNSVAST